MAKIKWLLYSWEKVANTQEKKWYVCRKLRIWELLLRNITRFSFSFSLANRDPDFNIQAVIICMPHAIPRAREKQPSFFFTYRIRSSFSRLLHICLIGGYSFAADNAERFDKNCRESLLCRRYTTIYRLEIRKWLVTRFSFLPMTKKIFNTVTFFI